MRIKEGHTESQTISISEGVTAKERGGGEGERQTDLLDSHVCLKKLSVVYMYAHERNLILMFLVGTMKLH